MMLPRILWLALACVGPLAKSPPAAAAPRPTTPDRHSAALMQLVAAQKWSFHTRGRSLTRAEAAHLHTLSPSAWLAYPSPADRESRANAWFKSPEALESTLEYGFGLGLTDTERWLFLQGMHALLGGTVTSNREAMISRPNHLYVLAVANLSTWLAGKLIDAQASAPADYLFEGLGLADADDAGCYADDAQTWCEARDDITLTTASAAGVDPAAISVELRKRLRHNVQDLGDFLYLDIGPSLRVAGVDAPSYLIDAVFLPALGSAPVTPERERAAWQLVLETILLSGAFFFEPP